MMTMIMISLVSDVVVIVGLFSTMQPFFSGFYVCLIFFGDCADLFPNSICVKVMLLLRLKRSRCSSIRAS